MTCLSTSRPAVTSKALRSKFKMMVLTMISYHDVAFTYDSAFLTARFVECKVCVRCGRQQSPPQDLVQKLIARHLTDKSKGRVENVFTFYGGGVMLDWRSALTCRSGGAQQAVPGPGLQGCVRLPFAAA